MGYTWANLYRVTEGWAGWDVWVGYNDGWLRDGVMFRVG